MESTEELSENQERHLNRELTDCCIKMDEGDIINLTVAYATFATSIGDVNERIIAFLRKQTAFILRFAAGAKC